MNQIIIAHRGASSLVPKENTLEAFEKAICLQVPYVEFDVRRTKDKKLVVFHDKKINNIPLRSLTYYELNEIAKKDGYDVPTFLDVLKLCQGKIKLDIELKETGYEQEVVSYVTSLYDYKDYMIKSFLDEVPYRIKQIDPNITCGLLIGKEKATLKRRLLEYFPKRRLKKCLADFISPNYRFLTIDFCLRMKLIHMPIYAWTINGSTALKKVMKKPIAGIITDTPDVALALALSNEKGYKKERRG